MTTYVTAGENGIEVTVGMLSEPQLDAIANAEAPNENNPFITESFLEGLIADAGDTNMEVVLARDGETVIGDRLDEIEAGTRIAPATGNFGGRVTPTLFNIVTELDRGLFAPHSYGAVADGTSRLLSAYYGSLAAAQADFPQAVALTDELDWAATMLAIAEAPTNGTLDFKHGYYRITRAIELTKHLYIEGRGSDDDNSPYTRIRQLTASEPVFEVATTADNKSLKMRNLWIYGGTRGIDISGAVAIGDNLDLQDLFIQHQTERGISAEITVTDGLMRGTMKRIVIEGNATYDLPYGVYLDGPNIAQLLLVEQLRVRQTSTAAFWARSSSTTSNQQNALKFINPTIEHNNGAGIHLVRTHAIIDNPFFETNCEQEAGATGAAQTGLADIYLGDTTNTAGTGASAVLFGGYFNSAGAGQDNGSGEDLRVKLDSTRCYFHAHGTRFQTTDLIDNNSLANNHIVIDPRYSAASPRVINPDTTNLTTVQYRHLRRHLLDSWNYVNVPTSAASVEMTRYTTATSWRAPAAGSVVAFGFEKDAATAGTITVRIFKNGAVQSAANQTTSTTATRTVFGEFAPGRVTFVADDLISVRITTDASWVNTTDVYAWLEVLYIT